MSVRVVAGAEDEIDLRIESAKKTLGLLSKSMLKLGLYFFWYMYEHIPVYYEEKSGEGRTDGTAIFLTNSFFSAGDIHRQLFVVLHELLHVAYRHPAMLASKLQVTKDTLDRNTLLIINNVIMDAVINKQIIDIFESKKLPTSFIRERYVDPDVVSKLIADDVSKLGFSLGIDRLVYLVKTGAVEVRAFTPSGREVDLRTADLDSVLAKEGRLLITFTNRATGGEVRISLHMDISSSLPMKMGGGQGEGDSGEYDVGERNEGGEGDATGEGGEKSGSPGKRNRATGRETREGEDVEGSHPGKPSGSGSGQRGKPIMLKKPITGSKPLPGDIDKLVRQAIDFEIAKRIVDEEKSAGAGAYMSAIYELLDVSSKKPRWLDRLKILVDDYLGNFKVYTWQKVHKRAPFVKPGYYTIETPHVVVMLDTSGSMLNGDLEKALSEIFGLVESFPDARVTLYQWSSTCSLPEKVDRSFVTKAKTHRKIPIITGGTEIEPALDAVLPTVRQKDLVVIMTDGYIYDIEKTEVQEKLRKLAKRSARTLFLTTSAVPRLPEGIEVIKIE